jgi:hypothetical protein
MSFSKSYKGKNRQVELLQTKNLCTANEIINKMKRTKGMGENICKPYI